MFVVLYSGMTWAYLSPDIVIVNNDQTNEEVYISRSCQISQISISVGKDKPLSAVDKSMLAFEYNHQNKTQVEPSSLELNPTQQEDLLNNFWTSLIKAEPQTNLESGLQSVFKKALPSSTLGFQYKCPIGVNDHNNSSENEPSPRPRNEGMSLFSNKTVKTINIVNDLNDKLSLHWGLQSVDLSREEFKEFVNSDCAVVHYDKETKKARYNSFYPKNSKNALEKAIPYAYGDIAKKKEIQEILYKKTMDFYLANAETDKDRIDFIVGDNQEILEATDKKKSLFSSIGDGFKSLKSKAGNLFMAVSNPFIKGAKYVGNKVSAGANTVFKSIGKAFGSLWSGTKWAGNKAKDGLIAGGKAVAAGSSAVWDGTKWTASKIFEGGKAVGGHILDGTKWVAQTAYKGIKNGATATWNGTKFLGGKAWEGLTKVGKGLEKGAKVTWNGATYVTKLGWNGTKMIGGKIWDGTKWVADKTWDGIKLTGQGLKKGSEVVLRGGKIVAEGAGDTGKVFWNGTKWVAKKSLDGVKKGATAVWDGAKWVGDKSLAGIKLTGQGLKKGTQVTWNGTAFVANKAKDKVFYAGKWMSTASRDALLKNRMQSVYSYVEKSEKDLEESHKQGNYSITEKSRKELGNNKAIFDETFTKEEIEWFYKVKDSKDQPNSLIPADRLQEALNPPTPKPPEDTGSKDSADNSKSSESSIESDLPKKQNQTQVNRTVEPDSKDTPITKLSTLPESDDEKILYEQIKGPYTRLHRLYSEVVDEADPIKKAAKREEYNKDKDNLESLFTDKEFAQFFKWRRNLNESSNSQVEDLD